jgi:hypothetical protein
MNAERVVVACVYTLMRGRIECRVKPEIFDERGVKQYAGVHFFFVDSS